MEAEVKKISLDDFVLKETIGTGNLKIIQNNITEIIY